VGAQTPESAEHYRIDVPSAHKMPALLALLEKEKPRMGLVFTRTREGSQDLAKSLLAADIPAIAFHGELAQMQRERIVESLKAGRTALVVATDVAARGLDIPLITHVVNYDIPEEAEQYVHRAGRTARAGRNGRIFTLVTENDGKAAEAIQRLAKRKLEPYPLTIETEMGDVDLGLRPLTPVKMDMPGGHARGARRKAEPTPPNPVWRLLRDVTKVKADPDEPERPEGDLPPSRKERRKK